MKDKALVVKVKKDPDGNITDVMLDNGNVYSINEVQSMAEKGLIESIVTKDVGDGKEYFKKSPTSLKDDNFNDLPEF